MMSTGRLLGSSTWVLLMPNEDLNWRRRGRIRAVVKIADLLRDYGYAVRGHDHEQQFSCDLHGDGSDSKPSARYYPKSNSFYCWACGRTRDPVALVEEKEGLSLPQALKALETRYGLPELVGATERDFGEVLASLGTVDEYEEERRRARVFLSNITTERAIALEVVLKLWESYDRVAYEHENGDSSPTARLMHKVRTVALSTVMQNEGIRQVHNFRQSLRESEGGEDPRVQQQHLGDRPRAEDTPPMEHSYSGGFQVIL
jgi:hypothetical protein